MASEARLDQINPPALLSGLTGRSDVRGGGLMDRWSPRRMQSREGDDNRGMLTLTGKCADDVVGLMTLQSVCESVQSRVSNGVA